jgi:hypothetical protein
VRWLVVSSFGGRCPGKVFTETLLRKPKRERWSEGTMLARGVRKPARATPSISASLYIRGIDGMVIGR